MSDELHKYPGNLKHHKVEEHTQEVASVVLHVNDKLDALQRLTEVKGFVRGYKSARAKDAELIQRLVDVLAKMAHYEALYRSGLSKQTVFENWQELASEWHEIRQLAAAAGFKPSEQ